MQCLVAFHFIIMLRSCLIFGIFSLQFGAEDNEVENEFGNEVFS